jgi:hypothetical protein
LDRVAGRGIRLWRLATRQNPLRHARQVGVRQVGETVVDALALAVPILAGRFRKAEALACLAQFPVCVVIRQRRDDAPDESAQQRQVHATRHHPIVAETRRAAVPSGEPRCFRRSKIIYALEQIE